MTGHLAPGVVGGAGLLGPDVAYRQGPQNLSICASCGGNRAKAKAGIHTLKLNRIARESPRPMQCRPVYIPTGACDLTWSCPGWAMPL